MTKTIEIQLEKSRTFAKGMKRHISEMGERGVTNDEIAKFENNLDILELQSTEVDKIRAELTEKVRRMNETFMTVKETYSETKKVIKGYYPQERWIDYGMTSDSGAVIYTKQKPVVRTCIKKCVPMTGFYL